MHVQQHCSDKSIKIFNFTHQQGIRPASCLPICLLCFHFHPVEYEVKTTGLQSERWNGLNVDLKAHGEDNVDTGMWLVINRSLEKGGEKHIKHARGEDGLSPQLYDLQPSGFLPASPPYSLRSGEPSACRCVIITSRLCGGDLEQSPTSARKVLQHPGRVYCSSRVELVPPDSVMLHPRCVNFTVN